MYVLRSVPQTGESAAEEQSLEQGSKACMNKWLEENHIAFIIQNTSVSFPPRGRLDEIEIKAIPKEIVGIVVLATERTNQQT